MNVRLLTFICIISITFNFAQTQIGNDIIGEGDYNFMGWDTAIADSGQIIAVGAPGNSSLGYATGQVKVMQFDGLNWVQIGADLLGSTVEDHFGRALDINDIGNTIIVGAQYNSGNGANSGSVEVYEYNGTDWLQKGSTIYGNSTDELGTHVKISNDGNRIAVTGPYANETTIDRGVLRVYDYDGSQWNLVFENYGDEQNDVFGMSLDMSGDGNQIICGAWINVDGTSKPGYAKVFQFDNVSWSQVGQTIIGETPGIFSGSSTAISDNGNIIAFGSWGNDENGTDSGEVEVFELVTNNWQQLGVDIQGNTGYNRFGWSLDLSSNGNILIVGASQGDYVNIYNYDGTNWVMIGNQITGITNLDDFGFSVNITPDANKIIIGAPYSDVNGSIDGFVQVYDIANILTVQQFNLPNISLFPIPAKNIININSKTFIKEVSLLDINGRLLKQEQPTGNNLKYKLDIKNLYSGTYFLRIILGNQKVVKKIIIE